MNFVPDLWRPPLVNAPFTVNDFCISPMAHAASALVFAKQLVTT